LPTSSSGPGQRHPGRTLPLFGALSLAPGPAKITDLDPLVGGLLGSRFLNPDARRRGRTSTSISARYIADRRDRVRASMNMPLSRGRHHQPLKLQARAVLRAWAAAGMPYGRFDRICKLVPNNPAKR